MEQTKDIEYCLVDDLRYQNEYEALIKNGLQIIQLQVSDELQELRIKEIYPENYKINLCSFQIRKPFEIYFKRKILQIPNIFFALY